MGVAEVFRDTAPARERDARDAARVPEGAVRAVSA
jgi:hypothetical protein